MGHRTQLGNGGWSSLKTVGASSQGAARQQDNEWVSGLELNILEEREQREGKLGEGGKP